MTAFAITLDAVLAVMVAGVVLTVSMELLVSREFVQDDYLLRYAYDYLAVAEKSGAVSRAIDGDIKPLKKLVDHIPASMCIELDVFSRFDSLVFHDQNFCVDQDKVSVASRLVLHEGEVYPTTIKLWYKYE